MLLNNNLRGVQHLGIPVVDIDRAKAWYIDKLGFRVIHEPLFPTDSGDIRVAFLEQGDLVLEFYQLLGEALEEIKRRSHGHIDHLALDCLDVDQAVAEAVKRGAVFDSATPDGSVFLPNYGKVGIKYAIFQGPTGERVELAEVVGQPADRRTTNLGGWSHLGIPAVNISAAAAFYRRFGFSDGERLTLPDGRRVVFMRCGSFAVELYEEKASALAAHADGHIDHIAFDVADIDAAYAEMQAEGLTPLEPAPVPLPFWEHGARYFNIRGLNGEKLEFNQKLG